MALLNDVGGYLGSTVAGGLKSGVDSLLNRKKKKYVSPVESQRKKLETLLMADNIDEVTKEEVRGLLGSASAVKPGQMGQGLLAISPEAPGSTVAQQLGYLKTGFETVAKAQEGTDPKFKARMNTQLAYQQLVDRPDANRLRGFMQQTGSLLRK